MANNVGGSPLLPPKEGNERMKDKQTVKQVPESKLRFIGQVVKKSMENYDTSWDMTLMGAAMLGIACRNNPGMALYMLDVINPQPNSVITELDIVHEFPLGFEGDWTATWDQFKQGDQRRVFKC